MLKRIFAIASLLLGLALPAAAQVAGMLTVALQQNIDINGRPVSGCLLNVYVVGTLATPQAIYSDPGLTTLLPNPLVCDTTGRIPMFYLGVSSVHLRLTDSGGLQIYDVPTMLVLAPQGTGGGGGGGPVDPTTIFATGDIKFRSSLETLTGWVILNATTIGAASSGASQRANADTQNLFVYLWNNCPQSHCPVSPGPRTTAINDFNANMAIQVPDFRGRTPVGLDIMNGSPAGRIVAANITSGGGDGVNTPNATGGESMHINTVAEMAAHTHTDSGHTHALTNNAVSPVGSTTPVGTGATSWGQLTATATGFANIQSTGGGAAANNMPPLSLGSWYMKL